MKIFLIDYSQYDSLFDLITGECEVIIGHPCHGLRSHLHEILVTKGIVKYSF
jgi:hypothetical protein